MCCTVHHRGNGKTARDSQCVTRSAGNDLCLIVVVRAHQSLLPGTKEGTWPIWRSSVPRARPEPIHVRASLARKHTVKANSGGKDDGDDESPKDQFFRVHAHHLGLCIITGNCRKGRTAGHADEIIKPRQTCAIVMGRAMLELALRDLNQSGLLWRALNSQAVQR